MTLRFEIKERSDKSLLPKYLYGSGSRGKKIKRCPLCNSKNVGLESHSVTVPCMSGGEVDQTSFRVVCNSCRTMTSFSGAFCPMDAWNEEPARVFVSIEGKVSAIIKWINNH